MPDLPVPVPVAQWAQALAVWQWEQAAMLLKPQPGLPVRLPQAQRPVVREQAAQQERLQVRPVLRRQHLKMPHQVRRRVLPARLTAVPLL